MSILQEEYDLFSYYRTKVKHQMTDEYERYQNRIQAQFKQDPKSFWAFVGKKRFAQSGKEITKGERILEGSECAHELAKYSHSVFSLEKPLLDVDEAMASSDEIGSRVHVDQLTLKDVLDALNRLKPKLPAGPDGIPAFVVKDCRSALASPLLHIFNMCLAGGDPSNT
ncbi:hypothetical protein O0L34_g12968 [Tuta absoluta]|nr:hypothetical protein O0L34_g12968 [Tuta absoluta]